LIDLALKQYEPHQIGIKISPTSRYNDLSDSNPLETFTVLIKELDKRNIGFVEIIETQEKESGPSVSFHMPAK